MDAYFNAIGKLWNTEMTVEPIVARVLGAPETSNKNTGRTRNLWKDRNDLNNGTPEKRIVNRE